MELNIKNLHPKIMGVEILAIYEHKKGGLILSPPGPEGAGWRSAALNVFVLIAGRAAGGIVVGAGCILADILLIFIFHIAGAGAAAKAAVAVKLLFILDKVVLHHVVAPPRFIFPYPP